ncbi:MAG: hypothetical protein Q9200_007106 [Gallowayella weberi]
MILGIATSVLSSFAAVFARDAVYNVTEQGVNPADAVTCGQAPAGIELRILSLGATIVAGNGSSDGNGFRAHLLDNLAGKRTEYVGTLRSGSMANNYHEGHSGFTISQTIGTAMTAIPFQPNIVLLHVGITDLSAGQGDYNGSTQRLGSLLDFLLEKLPDATILVCQIVGSKDAATNVRINKFNTKIPRLVEQRPGKHIIVVNMTSIQADQLVDGTHPNDHGYRVMDRQFHDGIEKALALGWVKPPSGPHLRPDPNLMGAICEKRRRHFETTNTALEKSLKGREQWTSLITKSFAASNTDAE